jgi:V/A-type H+-transporting ATPase subunit E
MEELRSTEILDQEIREDARRKAEKILKDAERDCAAIASEASVRIAELRAAKESETKTRVESYRRDAESRLPLDKERRLVSFIDSSVNAALEEWFRGIGPERRLALYGALLARYRPTLDEKRVRVSCSGYATDAARSIVEGTLGKGSILSVAELDGPEAARVRLSDGLLVEAEDRSLSFRATREELTRSILEDRRQELAEALFGGRLPE